MTQRPDNDAPRPGFDKWVSFRGQGAYMPTGGVAPGQVNMFNVDGTRVPQRGYITDELTDYALDWMRAHRSGRDACRPFFCYISHKAVHAEFMPPERHASAYADLALPRPTSEANTEANYLGKPMWVRNQRNSWHGVDFPYDQTSFSLADYERDYHRCLLAVDESMGRIRAWLEEAGIAQDTIVFFMSDNGFMFGEHGLIDKRCAYEPSIRVPLLAWAPGRFQSGAVIDEVVSNIDIAPTMLDLAGAPSQRHFHGRSFASLARGDAAGAWDNELIYEYYWEFNHPHTPSTCAIRTDRSKYIQYHGVWDTEELYDVQSDPQEVTNRIDDAGVENVKIELRRRLFEKIASLSGEHCVRYTERFNSGAVFRNLQGRDAAPFPERWLRAENAPDIRHRSRQGCGRISHRKTSADRACAFASDSVARRSFGGHSSANSPRQRRRASSRSASKSIRRLTFADATKAALGEISILGGCAMAARRRANLSNGLHEKRRQTAVRRSGGSQGEGPASGSRKRSAASCRIPAPA